MQCWEKKKDEFSFSYTTQAAFYAFLLSAGQDGLSVVFYVALAEREFKETNVSTQCFDDRANSGHQNDLK
jgi:hypothetical protein